MSEPKIDLEHELYLLAQHAKKEGLGSKFYQVLNEFGLNPIELYINHNRVYTEEDRKRLLLLKIKHEI